MERTRLPPVRGRVLRWVLAALVIAGVMAMHVLGGHNGISSRPMAMTPAGAGAAPTAAAPTDMSATDMSLHMSVDFSPAAATAAALTTAAGHGMSDMSCCFLFLITSAALVMLALLATARFGAAAAARGAGFLGILPGGRGPPGTTPPRFSLCVLRV